MSLFRSPLVVIDTETTGLPHDQRAEPWEVGAVRLDEDGVVVDTLHALWRPSWLGHECEAALAVSGMTAAELEALPPRTREDVDRIRDWIGGDWCVAYNQAFDREMLGRVDVDGLRWVPDGRDPMLLGVAYLQRMRVDAPDRWDGWEQEGLVQLRYGRPKWPKASELGTILGVPQPEGLHRALPDARYEAEILCALLRAGV